MWTLAALVGFVCVQSVVGDKNIYHFVYTMENGVDVPQDIVHDTDENTVLIMVGSVQNYPGPGILAPTVNFHDFDTGYVAFKDISRRQCYVSKSPIPFPVPNIYKKGKVSYKEFPRAYVANDTTALSFDATVKVAGQKIANFCREYTTFYRVLTHYDRTDILSSPFAIFRRQEQKQQLSNELEKATLKTTESPPTCTINICNFCPIVGK